MTDPAITNADLAATLAVLEEKMVVMPDVNIFDIEQQLGQMYDAAAAANNQQALVAINDSWARVQEIASVAQQHRDTALSAMDIAATFKNQRDNIAKELDEITEAVENMDNDHPLVADLIEAVEQGVYEWQDMYEDDSETEAQWEKRLELTDALNKVTGRTDEAATNFFEMLEGTFNPSVAQIDVLRKMLDSFAQPAAEGDDDE